ncbi:hypothetical protein PoB_006624300 [Plakobranchus ocellatus]|uniref:Transposase Tc1-like domain-containing protein n=1 Tax=Plakobranchus ocellatus TaxID=259542 RepID=A0AAV4D6G0_9GAST|nr:hypothetical protein PoB_006624300 [Plakobranchus ocellatus]
MTWTEGSLATRYSLIQTSVTVGLRLFVYISRCPHRQVNEADRVWEKTRAPDNLHNKTGLVVRAATVSRIMRDHLMAPHFPFSNKAADVRPGCKTQRIAPTLRQDESRS